MVKKRSKTEILHELSKNAAIDREADLLDVAALAKFLLFTMIVAVIVIVLNS